MKVSHPLSSRLSKRAQTSGMTLVEVMVAIGVSAVLLMALASITGILNKQQQQSATTFSADQVLHNIVALLNNYQAFQNDINDSTGNNSSLSCLKSGGTCQEPSAVTLNGSSTNPTGLQTTSYLQTGGVTGGSGGQIGYIYDNTNSPGNVLYKLNTATQGFSPAGVACNQFSATKVATPSDNCPYQYTVWWYPICPGGITKTCSANSAQIYLTVLASYATLNITTANRVAFNPVNYSSSFFQGSSMGGQACWTYSAPNMYETCATNVGIGTSAPSTALHVSSGTSYDFGTDTANVFIYTTSTGANTGGSLALGGPTYSWGTIKGGQGTLSDSGYLAFATRATASYPAERMRIDQNGNVGIGTTLPNANLDVNTGANKDLYFGQYGNGGTGYNQISLNGSLSNGGGDLAIVGGNSSDNNLYLDAPSNGSFVFRPNGTTSGPNNTGTVSISGSQTTFLNGNVGIGTTTPWAPLEIRGISDTSSAETLLGLQNYDGTDWFFKAYDTADGQGFAIWGNSGETIYAGPGGDAAIGKSRALYVNSSGNVGIGSTSPKAPLDVESSATMSIPGGTYLYTAGEGAYGAQAVNLSIYTPGNVVAGAYYATSDRRLKGDIEDLSEKDAWNFLKYSRPVEFNWKTAGHAHSYGFIAQDIAKLGLQNTIANVPDKDMKETEDADGFVSPKGAKFELNYDQLVAVLTKAVQLLYAKLENYDKLIVQLVDKATKDLSDKLDRVVQGQAERIRQLQLGQDNQGLAIAALSKRVDTLETHSAERERGMLEQSQKAAERDARVNVQDRKIAAQDAQTSKQEQEIAELKHENQLLKSYLCSEHNWPGICHH